MKIALAGLGTVGAGVARLLKDNAPLIAARAGRPVELVAVHARDKNKKRDCDVSGTQWVDNPADLASMPDIEAVVEVIGGADDPALSLARATLEQGKAYVTANKALLATHGAELARLAEAKGACLVFEAAVAGGLPVIQTLREGLAANRISSVRGILNGTCNYILSRMTDAGLGFEEALAEAKARGYAEADPSLDIDGHDSACKLAILAALAFGSEPDLPAVQVEGMRRITSTDIRAAAEMDFRIKLIGAARPGVGGLEQRVGPCLVPLSSPLASVGGALNGVLLEGHCAGEVTLIGQGAGAEPTASAVVADLIGVARAGKTGMFAGGRGLFAKRAGAFVTPTVAAPDSCYYVRLRVVDKPGVVADIAAILRDEAISIDALMQKGRAKAESVPVVIMTHAAPEASVARAARLIARLSSVKEPPCVMRIEE